MEINKKELKKILTEQREEYQRYLRVAVEGFSAKVDLIAEQYGDIKKTLDSHTEILEEHSKKLDLHTEILDSHSKKLDEHTEMIGSIMTDIEVLKEDMKIVKGSFKKKVDLKEFIRLEKRVVLLEKRLNVLNFS